MIVQEIGYDDLNEHSKNIVNGMVELTGILLMSGEYGKNVLDNMAKAYVKHRLLSIGPKLLYTSFNLTKSQHERYEMTLKSILSEEAYEDKVNYGDL